MSDSIQQNKTDESGPRQPADQPRPEPAPGGGGVKLAVLVVLLIVAVVIAIKRFGGRPDPDDPNVVLPDDPVLVFDVPTAERASVTLTLDGRPVQVTSGDSWEVHCKPGKHRVVAARHGFKPIGLPIEVRKGEHQTVEFSWQPILFLTIEMPIEDRQGAELRVDNHLLSLSNPKLEIGVEAGEHAVRILRPGFRPFEQTVNISATDSKPVVPTWAPDSSANESPRPATPAQQTEKASPSPADGR